LSLAACLAVVAITAGLLSFLGSSGVLGRTSAGSNADLGFMVRAYASDTDTVLETSSDDLIIFSQRAPDLIYGYTPSEGYYTDSLFRVQGKDITRIQASVSTGVLFRYSTERVVAEDDPERWDELASWKPTYRGTGAYYGGYDNLHMKIGDTTKWEGTAELYKKWGSTIDVEVSADPSEYTFGFWTNEDVALPGAMMDETDALLDVFDGATLTITVTLTDGPTITKIIELHTGDARVAQELDEYGMAQGTASIIPELITVEERALMSPEEYLHVIYGKVKETTSGPFPGSLTRANELADVVSDPMPFLMPGEVFDIVRSPNEAIAVDPENIHPADDTLSMMLMEYDPQNGPVEDALQPYLISNLTASRSKTLPEGITRADLGGFGSWEGINRITGELDGYTLDEVGTPSEGFSWVLFEADITNASDAEHHLSSEGSQFGQLAIWDAENNVSRIVCRSFRLLNGGGWDPSSLPEYGLTTFTPQETKTLRWLFVVPDFAFDDPTLFFQPTKGYQEHPVIEGFKLTF
jgi:hypothetical protein